MHDPTTSPRHAHEFDHYVAWRAAAHGVEQEFRAWRTSRDGAAFAAYGHALERESALALECTSGLRDAHALGLVRLRGDAPPKAA
jgi:hypothetical protein